MEAIRASSSSLLTIGMLNNTALFTALDLEELLDEEELEEDDG